MAERIPVPGGYLVWQDVAPAGLRFVLQTAWDDGFAPALRAHDVVGIVLSIGLGWPGGSLEFLRGFRDLRSLALMRWDHRDISALASLKRLECINLECQFGAFDFDALPNLRDATVRWRPGAASLLVQPGLEKLLVDGYPHEDLRPLAGLQRLRHLDLTSRKLASLEGLADLGSLRSLHLYNCPALADFSALGSAPALEVLEFNACRGVCSLEPMAALESLKRLKLEQSGRVGSVRPLQGLKHLEELYLIGITVEDGDLSPLLSLPSLRRVALARSRRHSHTVAQIEAALASR
jgi:Leucine-rich repeat (LRR) protein